MQGEDKGMEQSHKRLAVVTGASEGIGAAIALELAERGFGLILNARNEEKLSKKAEELRKKGIACSYASGDIGRPETAERIFAMAEELLMPDQELVLVNNAGISHIGLIQDMTDEEWQKIISVNLSSVFYTCRKAIPLMLRNKKGHIVNLSSVWGSAGASMEAAYSASKGGVEAFTKALAKELAPSGIAVNAISPGVIDTRMNACFSDEEREELRQEIPAGRFGDAAEAARLCAFLCECDSYITGQIIGVDGGWI